MNRPRIRVYMWLMGVSLSLSMLNCHDFGETMPVNFFAMSVGQHSQYVRFTLVNWFDSTGGTMVIHRDTLLLQVVARSGNTFYLNESYDSTSHDYMVSMSTNEIVVSQIDSRPGTPQIFCPGGLPIAPLQMPIRIDSPEFHMVGWRTSGEDCECNRAGYITNYSQFGRQYGHANVFVDNGPMTYDGLGYTCVYTSDEGVLRSSLASAWTRDMEGWLFIR